MLVCAFFTHFGTRDRGCSAHPAFPAPSVLRVRTQEFASLGRNRAARTPTHTHSSSPGLTGRPSIPEAPMIEPRSRGVLDRPVKPGDDGCGASFSVHRDDGMAWETPAKP